MCVNMNAHTQRLQSFRRVHWLFGSVWKWCMIPWTYLHYAVSHSYSHRDRRSPCTRRSTSSSSSPRRRPDTRVGKHKVCVSVRVHIRLLPPAAPVESPRDQNMNRTIAPGKAVEYHMIYSSSFLDTAAIRGDYWEERSVNQQQKKIILQNWIILKEKNLINLLI